MAFHVSFSEKINITFIETEHVFIERQPSTSFVSISYSSTRISIPKVPELPKIHCLTVMEFLIKMQKTFLDEQDIKLINKVDKQLDTLSSFVKITKPLINKTINEVSILSDEWSDESSSDEE